MRIILAILLCLGLCGCQKSTADQLKELGYSEEETACIETLSETLQERFLQEYDTKALYYVMREDFEEEKLEDYLRYDGKLDTDKMVELVNKGILNETDLPLYQQLYGSEFYLPSREDLYLKYLKEYDTVRDVIEIVNTNRYRELYEGVEETDLSKGYLILVNKYYQLPSDYEPDDLVSVDPALGRGKLRNEVYEAYKRLYADAKEEGYDLKVLSAYRSYGVQNAVYNGYLEIDPKEVVDTYSARPGHSEHQSGLCLDVSEPGYSLDDFYLTEASVWLKENCHKYGFIIRYPEDKTGITGYQGEPWQIRYLGVKTATDVIEKGITYDEYYACFVEKR